MSRILSSRDNDWTSGNTSVKDMATPPRIPELLLVSLAGYFEVRVLDDAEHVAERVADRRHLDAAADVLERLVDRGPQRRQPRDLSRRVRDAPVDLHSAL